MNFGESLFLITRLLCSEISSQAPPLHSQLIVHCTGSLRWRHNEQDGVLNHQPYHCLLNRLFRRRSKKVSKLRVTGLCAGNNSPHKWPVTRKMYPFDDVIMMNRFPCPSALAVWGEIDGLVLERCNSSALAMELRLSCTNTVFLAFMLSDGTKPLREPILINDQWTSVALTQAQFHRICWRYQFVKYVLKSNL